MKRILLAYTPLAIVLIMTAGTALADPFVLGAAGNFAVYGFGTGTTVELGVGPIAVNGNVGVGAGADATLQGTGVDISGHVYYSSTPVKGTGFSGTAVTGGNFYTANGTDSIDGTACTNNNTCFPLAEQSGLATSASTDILNMYGAVKGLATTSGSPSGNLTSSFTWSGSGGTNVADLTGFGYSSGDVLTLKGSASDYFIFDISGGWSMSGSAKIVLNGVSSDHVVFNMLETADGGTGAAITASGSSVGSGIIMGLDRNITFDTPGGSWSGRLFSSSGKTIHLFSDATINQPASAVPEPSSLTALGGLLLAGVLFQRRARSKSGA